MKMGGPWLKALLLVPLLVLGLGVFPGKTAAQTPFEENQNVTPVGTEETVVGKKSTSEFPKPPTVIPMKSQGANSITTASAEFDSWFAEAMKIAKDWKFPELKNQYGKIITREDFFRAVLWIESNGVHKNGKGTVTKSYIGALGFGQLMPNTAKGLGVDPKDARQNLLGSAKYIKEIMNSAKIQKVDDPMKRMIMSMAAYNLGPYSKLLERDWDVLKARGPAETASYGLKLKMCLGLSLTDSEKTLTAKFLGVKLSAVPRLENEYYAHSHGL